MSERFDGEAVRAAQKQELDSWTSNVYQEVPDVGKCALSIHWVITEKILHAKKCIKAHLVARGYEEQEVNLRTDDSPTCSRESLRIVLSITASNNWKCRSVDIKATFLQGSQIERDIYLRPPSEADQSKKLWKLKTCVYGLSDAPHSWYVRVRDEFENLRVKASIYDHALFFWHEETGFYKGSLHLMLMILYLEEARCSY